MSIDKEEDQSSNNNSDDGYSKFIKDVNKSTTIGFHSREEDHQEKEWTNSFYGYEYKTIVPAEKESGPILGVRIELHIHKEKLDIIEKIVQLKYGTMSGTFIEYIEEALRNQVENDLRSPDTIAIDLQKLAAKVDE